MKGGLGDIEADSFIVCERYSLLPNDKKQMIAGELDRSVREIERKISVGSPPRPAHYIRLGQPADQYFAGHADTGGVLIPARFDNTTTAHMINPSIHGITLTSEQSPVYAL